MTSFLVALLALAAPAKAIPSPQIDEEIVVRAEKLRSWRGSVRSREGAMRCTTKRSTGDADLDAIGCDTMIACIPQAQPILTVAAKAAKGKARRRLEAEASAKLTACAEAEHDRRLAQLGDRRHRESGPGHEQD